MAFAAVVEHLNQLEIVAEVCWEIGVTEWLSALHRLVSRLFGPTDDNCYVVSHDRAK